MTVLWLVLLPLLGGPLAWLADRRGATAARRTALAVLAADLVLALTLWPRTFAGAGTVFRVDWLPAFGISVHLELDGLSLLMVLLTLLLGLLAVGASWREVTARTGFFHFNLLWILGGILAVFLARDLFLFYFAWELMLVPMTLLIAVWGHERRVPAAIRFFLFTQAGGLLLLLGILGLVFAHAGATGEITFALADLLDADLGRDLQVWLFLGFCAAFAVKLPVVPLHVWLPLAHTEAPTAGSVILAGLLLKTGAYGLLRFAVPLFPEAAAAFAPAALVLGVVGILYGALLAFGQTDLKRLVAYTSVSHLGFVLLGVFAGGPLGRQGAVMQMIAHGLSTGGLFVLVGVLQERTGTRRLDDLGGLWPAMPRAGGLGLVLALASLGLPGLANFVAEILILFAVYRADVAVAALAALGLVAAAVYALWSVQKVFHGPRPAGAPPVADLDGRELLLLGGLAVVLLGLGLWPGLVLDAAGPALAALGGLPGGAP